MPTLNGELTEEEIKNLISDLIFRIYNNIHCKKICYTDINLLDFYKSRIPNFNFNKETLNTYEEIINYFKNQHSNLSR